MTPAARDRWASIAPDDRKYSPQMRLVGAMARSETELMGLLRRMERQCRVTPDRAMARLGAEAAALLEWMEPAE